MNTPIVTLTRSKPLDFPEKTRPFRIYAALTNTCNRKCPWCSACSSPGGKSFLTLTDLVRHFPATGDFEVQLEGGEPLLHPEFWEFVSRARTHPRCTRIVVVTNGTRVPRIDTALLDWLDRFGREFTLKLSVNHYLLDRDPGLLDLAERLFLHMGENGDRGTLVLNVRLRKGSDADKQNILEAVAARGLLPCANVFHLQRYGFASDQPDWDPPYVVEKRFTLLNPDGRSFGTDIVARAEAMDRLP